MKKLDPNLGPGFMDTMDDRPPCISVHLTIHLTAIHISERISCIDRATFDNDETDSSTRPCDVVFAELLAWPAQAVALAARHRRHYQPVSQAEWCMAV